MFNKIKNDFCEPLSTITKQPYHFMCWLLVAIVLGLLSLWITMFSSYINETNLSIAYGDFLKGKNLATFSIVILAEGIAGALLSLNSGKSDSAVGVRAIAGILCIIILVFLSLVVFTSPSAEPFSNINKMQLIFSVLAVILAIYMYCFRSSEWEKSADDVRKKDDDNVAELEDAAAKKSVDNNGVSL